MGIMLSKLVVCVNRYVGLPFSTEWLKNLKKYFGLVREVKIDGDMPELAVGQPADALYFISTR